MGSSAPFGRRQTPERGVRQRCTMIALLTPPGDGGHLLKTGHSGAAEQRMRPVAL